MNQLAEHGLTLLHGPSLQVRAPLAGEFFEVGVRHSEDLGLLGRLQILKLDRERLPLVLQRIDPLNQRTLMPDLGEETGQLLDLPINAPDFLAHLRDRVVLVGLLGCQQRGDLLLEPREEFRGEHLLEYLVQNGALERFLLDRTDTATVMAAVIAPISVDSRAALAVHQARQQVVVAPIPGQPVLLLVTLAEYSLRFRVCDHRLMCIAANLPIRPVAIPAFAASHILAVNEFPVAIPDSMSGVGQGAVFEVDERGIGNPGLEFGLECPSRLTACATFHIPLHVVERPGVPDQLAFRQRLTLARADHLFVQLVPEDRFTAGAPSLSDVLAHPSQAVHLALVRVEFIEGLHEALDDRVQDALGLRQLEEHQLDALRLEQVLVDLCVVLPPREPARVIAVQDLETASFRFGLGNHRLEGRALVSLGRFNAIRELSDDDIARPTGELP